MTKELNPFYVAIIQKAKQCMDFYKQLLQLSYSDEDIAHYKDIITSNVNKYSQRYAEAVHAYIDPELNGYTNWNLDFITCILTLY